MKKLFTLSAIAAFAVSILAQPPQLMSYQSVVRTASGELITKQSIGVRTTILRGSIIQITVYQETYSPNPSTNENGLLTLDVGSGTPSTGDFSKIDWSNGPYFLRTEMDPKGGTNYTIAGSSQILSVPYALYAEKTGTETDPVWTGASGNYYTKTNLQTSGQASVHWNNLSNMDADVEDLEDGSLSGSKVGTGISADNITSGTLPLGRLSGITTAQLSASAGIISGQITSLAANKVTGISENFVPRSNGTGLVTGKIFDNGTQVGIGIVVPKAQLHVGNYEGPQLMFGSTNQPNLNWYFSVSPASHLSLVNEKKGTPYTAIFIDNNSNNMGIGTTSPTAKLHVEGTVKVGVNGKSFSELTELTGTTGGSSTYYVPVAYPSGYTRINTRVLSVEINASGDVWVGLGFNNNDVTKIPISYNLSTSEIYVFYPNSAQFQSRSFRVLLMKVE